MFRRHQALPIPESATASSRRAACRHSQRTARDVEVANEVIVTDQPYAGLINRSLTAPHRSSLHFSSPQEQVDALIVMAMRPRGGEEDARPLLSCRLQCRQRMSRR